MEAGFTPPPALDGRCSSSHTLTSPSGGGIGPRAQLEEPIPAAILQLWSIRKRPSDTSAKLRDGIFSMAPISCPLRLFGFGV